MSGSFTAEDFAQANLATKGRFEVARRTDPRLAHQWHVYGGKQGCFSDEEMAADGWTPVVESRITERTLRRVEERAERKRRKLIDHIDFVEAALRDRNARVATLLDTKTAHEQAISDLRHDLAVERKERERLAHDLRRSLGRPKGDNATTLDGLEAAWEAAEQADECREGDVLIIRDDEDNYLVRRMDDRSDLDSTARVLSRAPREPWVELAGVLHDVINQGGDDRIDVDSAAARLYAEGVRVTCGDDDA